MGQPGGQPGRKNIGGQEIMDLNNMRVKDRRQLSLDITEEAKLKRVIGIDLTGSEKRASGVATLWGNQVRTKRWRTDDDIVLSVCAENPDLVSIDSPLSLPEDNTKIYRDCELTLKLRGIGVYWCLLPSMKNLTLRGIVLAKRLRDSGYQVIESYPGAAQDILGIPRKGKSIEALRQGLADYGIIGDLQVSHDELDAITSAIVGQLYLEGKYEALGCLIIPKVSDVR
jgi:predicted nuclease with RNAse H fold